MSFTRNLNNYINEQNQKIKERKQKSTLKEESKFISGKGEVIEDYNLLEEIGHGSFGQVFRATQLSNGKQKQGQQPRRRKEYAIKCINKLKAPNIAKILSEVSIHVRLEHEHILQLANVLEDTKNVYLVMEMCHGGTLAQLINGETISRKESARNGEELTINSLRPVLPYELIQIILRQVCQGLRYLHRHSIVHRDLNLNNILLVEPLNFSEKQEHRTKQAYHAHSIRVKIADFGLAIDLKTTTESMTTNVVLNKANPSPLGSTICGTPGFISPEIWTQMRTVSYKSDIFSLGSIMFACISGYTPKGDIDLSDFLPMTANLITVLLDPNPDKRPELDDIEKHIFMSGLLVNTHRLYPIVKKTDSLIMSIDDQGRVEVIFLPSHLTIEVIDHGHTVLITTAEAQLKRYYFFELPEVYWKRYGLVEKFVNLVAAKTPKITVHCGQWFRERFDEDEKSTFISRCVLMENNDFEVTLQNLQLNKTTKLILGENKHELGKYQTWLEALCRQVNQTEAKVLSIYDEIGVDLFPVSFGNNARVLAMRKQQVKQADNIDNYIDSKTTTKQKEANDVNSMCSFISNCNRIEHSINISGLGNAVFFADGVLRVNFVDGSNLCYDMDGHINYTEQDGQPQVFEASDILPEVVLQKIATLPQVIKQFKMLPSSGVAAVDFTID